MRRPRFGVSGVSGGTMRMVVMRVLLRVVVMRVLTSVTMASVLMSVIVMGVVMGVLVMSMALLRRFIVAHGYVPERPPQP